MGVGIISLVMKNNTNSAKLLPIYQSQANFFWHIYQTRPHKSEVSGEPIRFAPACFAHVLPKGSYPHFKYLDLNIVLMTVEEHNLYDHETHKARQDPRFDWVFLLGDLLRRRYHQILKT